MPMPRVKGAFPLVSRVNLICIICAMHEEMLVLVHLILQKGKRYFFFLDTFRALCAATDQYIRTCLYGIPYFIHCVIKLSHLSPIYHIVLIRKNYSSQ